MVPNERGPSVYSRKFISMHGSRFGRRKYDGLVRRFTFGKKPKKNQMKLNETKWNESQSEPRG